MYGSPFLDPRELQNKVQWDIHFNFVHIGKRKYEHNEERVIEFIYDNYQLEDLPEPEFE